MAADFKELVTEICRLAEIPNPDRFQDSAEITVDGVRFTMVEGMHKEALQLIFFADFGLAPPGELRSKVLQRLLEMNAGLFGLRSPVLAMDPETEHVVMMGLSPISELKGEVLLQVFAGIASHAKEWQKNYFLTPPGTVKRKTGKRLLGAIAV